MNPRFAVVVGGACQGVGTQSIFFSHNYLCLDLSSALQSLKYSSMVLLA